MPSASDRLLVSLRSPLPLLVAGLGLGLLVIAAVTLPPRQPAVDASRTENISPQEALTIVADQVRSSDGAVRVMTQGQPHFEGGTWTVTLGDAHFHFSQRNRIVVADDEAAARLKYETPTGAR